MAINAPEQDECYYTEALEYLIETVKGRKVALHVVDVDQFGRTLAHVFRGETHVNLDLVRRGLAIATTPGEDDRYGETILGEEQDAYDEGRGLWSSAACGAGPLPTIIIDGLTSSPDPTGPDDENLAGEIIVIVSLEPDPLDLTGWTVRDESSRHRYRIPAGTTLNHQERLIIASDNSAWDPGGSPVWNNDGDMGLLLDDDGRVVDRWRYSDP